MHRESSYTIKQNKRSNRFLETKGNNCQFFPFYFFYFSYVPISRIVYIEGQSQQKIQIFKWKENISSNYFSLILEREKKKKLNKKKTTRPYSTFIRRCHVRFLSLTFDNQINVFHTHFFFISSAGQGKYEKIKPSSQAAIFFRKKSYEIDEKNVSRFLFSFSLISFMNFSVND